VENFVENFASIFNLAFKNPGNFDNARHSLCKSVKIVREKKFKIKKKLVSSQFFVIFSKKLLKV